MIFHSLCRLSLLFFHSFLFIPKLDDLNSIFTPQILSSAWSDADVLYGIFFISLILFTASEFCFLSYDFYFFVKLLMLFTFRFPDFVELSFFFLLFYLTDLPQNICFKFLSDESQIYVSLGSVTRRLLWSFGGITFPWYFNVPWLMSWIAVFASEVADHPLQILLSDFGGEFHQPS